jgi:hypothetical protein
MLGATNNEQPKDPRSETVRQVAVRRLARIDARQHGTQADMQLRICGKDNGLIDRPSRAAKCGAMTVPPVQAHQDETPDAPAELRNAVACELYAQLALRGETIDLAAAAGVADAVARRLVQTFRIEWVPVWAGEPDDDEPLGSEAAVFHASTMPPASEPSAERYPIFDR